MAASVAEARPEVGTDNVLVLYSNGRLFPANVEGDRGLHQAVLADASQPVALFYEFLDAPRFGGSSFETIFAAYLRDKYASRPPRVLIAVSQEALSFLMRYRDGLYPGIPIVQAGVDRSFLRSFSPLPADVNGVPADYSFRRTIETALRWHPQAKQLVVVTGASARDRDPPIPVIVITAFDAPGVREEALQRGAAAYPVKPFLGTTLIEAIRSAITRGISP